MSIRCGGCCCSTYLYQLLALGVSLGLALGGGALTGVIISYIDPVSQVRGHQKPGLLTHNAVVCHKSDTLTIHEVHSMRRIVYGIRSAAGERSR
jgi:hypothetical protein